MAFDPNLYAIQIELGIDAAASFDALNELERKATNVEASLNKAMSATLAQTAAQLVDFNKQLELNNTSIVDYGTQQSLNIEKFNDYTKDNLKYTDEMQKQLDLYKEIQELYTHQNEAFQLSSEIQDAISDKLKNQSKSFIQMMNDAGKAYLGFDTGKKIINQHGKEVDRTTNSQHKFESSLHKIDGAFRRLSNTVQSYWVYFLKLTDATERFITVNNRAYGSMHEIVGQTQLTALSYGLLTESALQATEALIGIGVAPKELEELTVALVKTNRVTGLTYESLAELARQTKDVTGSTINYTKAINTIMVAQRTFSLNVAQTQKILDVYNQNLFRLTGVLGKDAPQQFLKAILSMQVLSRETGAGADIVEDYTKKLNAQGEELLRIHAIIGTNPFGDMKSKTKSIDEFYDNYAKALAKSGKIGSEAYQEAETYMRLEVEAMGFNMNQVIALTKLRQQAGMAGKSLAQIQAIMNKRTAEGRDINGEYIIGMQGLVVQWNRLRDAVTNSLGPLINWIADGMWPWLKIMSDIIIAMYQVGAGVLKFYRGLETTIPGLKMVRGWVQVLIGGLLLLTGGVIVLTAALASVVVGILAFISSLVVAVSAVLGFGGAIATFFAGAAASINAFLARVAAAVGRLGAAMTPLIAPMLAFGASVLMVGAGVWLLAQAFDAVAKHGWAGVAMFTAFIGVILLFGLAIVGLGYLSMAAAPGLLALGAAILMIGVGVALMVGSVALLVMAFTGLLRAITPDIKDRVIGLADGLVYLASYGPVIAMGLAAIGFSLASVMIPLGLASLALLAIGAALSMISSFKVPAIGDELSKLADEILGASDKLTEAGWALLPAASALIVGSLALMGSAISLALASGVMFAAGALLVASGAIFVVGTGLFLAGATMFKTGANHVLSGANVLLVGAGLIPEATALLIIAASDLLSAGLLLLPGSMILAASARFLVVAGVSLLLAVPSLMAGAIGFYFAASAMSKGIEKLEKSSVILYRFAIAARTLERLSFAGMRQGINDLGASASDIDKYVNDMEKASLSLQNVRFDVTGFSNSISVAADVLTAAVAKLQIPIDKLSLNINEMVAQIDRLVDQEARVSELGANLNSAMPDKAEDLQKPAEFRKADGQTDIVNNIIEVKNDSAEMITLLKRMVVLMEGEKDETGRLKFGSLMVDESPNRRLKEIGINM